MADETPAATPPAAEAASGDGSDVMATFVAELNAAPTETPEGEAPAPAETPAEEKPAEPVEPVGDKPAEEKQEAKEPWPEDKSERRARAMLEAASRKESKALKALPEFKASLAAKLREDPDGALADLGLDLDGLIDAKIASRNGTKPPEDKVAQLEAQITEMRLARENEVLEQKFNAAKSQVLQNIEAAGAKYPKVNKDPSRRELVTDLMVEYHNAHGVPLPWTHAAAQVETYLRSLADEPALPAPSKAPSTAKPPASTRPGTVTLKNDDGRPPTRGNEAEELDDDAAYQAALREIERM